MSVDISPATTLLLDYNPRFAYSDFNLIRAWIADGCDLERDIVPAMKACMKAKQDIKGLSYFTQAVNRARDIRRDTEEAQKALADRNEHLGLTADERRAKNIAFLTRKLGRRMPTDERWLAGYEAAHGPVGF